jgi:thiosulfate reductase cytochrome b subunit
VTSAAVAAAFADAMTMVAVATAAALALAAVLLACTLAGTVCKHWQIRIVPAAPRPSAFSPLLSALLHIGPTAIRDPRRP